jgi:selenocysteine-specific elongation factor
MIDVPGHERFLKNMAAGATSIDLALLVIAADDGPMPQTREHLDVLELLGVRRGVVALTKIDLVDEEMRLLVEEEIESMLAGRSLQGSPIVPVSSVTGEGMDALRATLERILATIEPRSAEGAFRMPVQRVFSLAGFGTILTGIPLAGEIKVGETVEIVGKGLRSRIRGIHAYGRSVDQARAGHSTALNLPEIPLAQAARGDVVAVPDRLEAVDRLEMEVRMVGDVTPLRHGETVHLHLGTSELIARVFLLDSRDLPPRGVGLAQIVCEAAVACLPGDFGILRRLTPARTIAGGRVIGVGGRRLRRFREEVIDRLRAKEESLDSRQQRLAVILIEAGEPGLSRDQCLRRLGWTPQELDEALRDLLATEEVCQDKRSGRLFARRSVDRERERILATLAAYYEKHPLSSTCPIGELRREAGEDILDVALGRLEEEGRLKVLPGGMIQDPARESRVSQQDRGKLGQVAEWVETAGSRAHSRDELLQEFGAEAKVLLERLLEERLAVAVGPEFVWGAAAYGKAVGIVGELCGQVGGTLDIPSLRDRLDTSRKYLIPFLEHLDRVGITARKGDRRILRRIEPMVPRTRAAGDS